MGVYTTRDDSKFCFVDLASSVPEAVAEFTAPRNGGEVGKLLELKEGLCLFEDEFSCYETREEGEKFVIESIAWKDEKLPEALLTWTRWLNNEVYYTPEMDVDEIDESERSEELPKRKPSLLSWNRFGTF